jgi:hypothetical protein
MSSRGGSIIIFAKKAPLKILAPLLLVLVWTWPGIVLAASPQNTVIIPDDGWRLWPDTQAPWRDDALYLPDDVDLSKLPTNAPTGGWQALDGQNGMAVTLPTSVEQHYWGKFGLRPYNPQESPMSQWDDTGIKNGNYEGVSWWWRDIDVPASFSGKTVLLHVRAARQRAEVYVNHQLAGYDMIAETAFDCDVSKALVPGQKNQIAIRITNPGGGMDFQDYYTVHWNKYEFQRSRGFGGLDRALTLTAQDPVYFDDTWVLNTPQVRTITAHATIRNTTGSTQKGTAEFDVVDPKTSAVVATKQIPISVPANMSQDFGTILTYDKADLWDLNTPRLYTLHSVLKISGDKAMTDEAVKTFGFRWFEPRGVGEQAGLYLNGRRIRLYTAISWGFWGLDGIWPTPELAEKEVRAAKQLNMNMINCHRDLGKEEVMAKQDELGLLRYMEPGGGGLFMVKKEMNPRQDEAGMLRVLERDDGGQYPLKSSPGSVSSVDTSGLGGGPQDFSERYIDFKIVRMIKQFRSHPSQVIDVLQNETDVDFSNPHIFYILRQMHALDPSRIIAAKSGISVPHEVWFPPYSTDPMVDDGTGYSGWRDEHTVGGPGVWMDSMYSGPDNFTHRIDDRREIVDWGEMLGSAVGDNHALMVEQIKARGGESYDLQDHEELANAYHKFLDKWGFRAAFPTDEAFYRSLGDKCYAFWGRVLETVRLCESNDILTMSGWESTAIENHSGILDNLRNFKGNPDLIAAKLEPLLPVVEPHATVYKVGDTATLDLYLVNETGRPARGRLQLTLVDPRGLATDLGTYAAPSYAQDQFDYKISTDVTTPPLEEEGQYKLLFTLNGDQPAKNSEILLAVKPIRSGMPLARIGVLGSGADGVLKALADYPELTSQNYQENETYDLVIAAGHAALNGALTQNVQRGEPLLVLAGDEGTADASARQLAATGAFQYAGVLGHSRAPWLGSWVFVRQHALYSGLPVNEVMKGDYQAPPEACFGLMIDGPGVEVVAGYSRDHSRQIGATTFTAKLGRGRIVFQSLTGMNPIMQERWLGNAVAYLLAPR